MASTVDSIVYVGAHDAVEVPDAGIIAERDKPVKVGNEPGQVSEDVALRLLEQPINWSKGLDAKATSTKVSS